MAPEERRGAIVAAVLPLLREHGPQLSTRQIPQRPFRDLLVRVGDEIGHQDAGRRALAGGRLLAVDHGAECFVVAAVVAGHSVGQCAHEDDDQEADASTRRAPMSLRS